MQGVNLINKAAIKHKVSRSLTVGVAVFVFVASLAACQSPTDEAAIGSTPAWLKVLDFYDQAQAQHGPNRFKHFYAPAIIVGEVAPALPVSPFTVPAPVLVLAAAPGAEVTRAQGPEEERQVVQLPEKSGAKVVQADALKFDLKEEQKLTELGKEFFLSAEKAAKGETEQAALNLTETFIEYLIQGIGADAPDWLKRTEFEWRLAEDASPEYSLLTVQPLYESEGNLDTVFAQFSQRRYNQHTVDRDVTNIGLGYRRLLKENTILAGTNAFFDYDWEYHHQRYGLGGELMWSGMDLRANWYRALTETRTVTPDIYERVMDGHDLELSLQVPYLPWARIHGKKFWWDSEATDDVRGWRTGLEMDLHQNLQVEVGATDSSAQDLQFVVQFRFKPAKESRKVALSNMPIDNTAWQMRDMREHTLDKVRRENKIITERTVTATVKISRGS